MTATNITELKQEMEQYAGSTLLDGTPDPASWVVGFHGEPKPWGEQGWRSAITVTFSGRDWQWAYYIQVRDLCLAPGQDLKQEFGPFKRYETVANLCCKWDANGGLPLIGWEWIVEPETLDRYDRISRCSRMLFTPEKAEMLTDEDLVLAVTAMPRDGGKFGNEGLTQRLWDVTIQNSNLETARSFFRQLLVHYSHVAYQARGGK